MTTIYKYRVYCVTDNRFEYLWSESEPTKCPINTAHTIDRSKTSIIATKSDDSIHVKEESTPTGGYFKTETVVMNIDASSTFEQSYSWPYPISILAVYLVTTSAHEGDNLEISVSPKTTIGTITSNVTANDTVITVSDTVIENAAVGHKLYLDEDDLGYIISINADTKQVTVTTAAANSFSSGTAVKRTVFYAENYEIGPPWEYIVGESKIGGSYLPANATIYVKYTNNEADSKKFIARLEFLY